MKQTKVLLTLACAILLVAASVMGTLAYLTATTGTVTNTFTVGKVSFDTAALDEAKVNEYGKPVKNTGTEQDPKYTECALADAPRVAGNSYKLVPGHKYTKDPTVHIGADSEDAWLFVKIENGIKNIEAATTIHDQMVTGDAAKWTVVDATNGIYAYKTIVHANDDIVVFSEFTLKNDAAVASYANAKITVKAGIVQAEGFASAAAAWTANSTLFNTPT